MPLPCCSWKKRISLDALLLLSVAVLVHLIYCDADADVSFGLVARVLLPFYPLGIRLPSNLHIRVVQLFFDTRYRITRVSMHSMFLNP